MKDWFYTQPVEYTWGMESFYSIKTKASWGCNLEEVAQNIFLPHERSLRPKTAKNTKRSLR